MTLLAALDAGDDTDAILDVAQRVAELLGTEVEGVAVADVPDPRIVAETSRRGLGLRTLDGPVVAALTAAAQEPGVLALVVGGRGRPANPLAPGPVTQTLMTSLPGPLLVVPPDGRGSRPIRRVLVALDGSPEAAKALEGVMQFCAEAGVDVVVVHVLVPEDAPAFADQPHHWSRAFAEEFGAHNVPAPEVAVQLRTGDPPERLLDAAKEVDADLVALAWSQSLAPGHAAVVQRAVTRGGLPVLLLPVAPL